MYQLIGNPKNRSFRVLWALEELDADYEIILVNPGSHEAVSANPSGKSPALKDGEEFIIDSVAIVQYLADKHVKLTFPAGTIERAKQDSFTQLVCDDFDACLWQVGRHTFILPEEVRIPEVIDVQRYLFTQAIENLDQRFADAPYLMGDTFTVPDILLTHCLSWASRYESFSVKSDKINDYFKRCVARPAFQRAHEIRATS